VILCAIGGLGRVRLVDFSDFLFHTLTQKSQDLIVTLERSQVEVTDRVIVVTGAARGIGRALARRFSSAGAAAVVVADLDGDGARAVADEIGGMAATCDVSREDDVVRLVDRVQSDHGRIDIFCSNAGIAVAGGPETATADWQRIWEVNVMSHVFVARHVLPGMLARKQGYLLGTVSAAGLLNHVFAAPYGATKAAALSLFEWLAIAHGDEGIRVSCLCPQGVKTDMLAAERREGLDFLTATALEPEAVADVVLQGIREESFLILPHPEVAEYFRRKAVDYDRWLRGMRRLRASIIAASSS
jgi:NAD(P)-dependent dehydrogenase (short-subunit alcohol dehydrogenase family)